MCFSQALELNIAIFSGKLTNFLYKPVLDCKTYMEIYYHNYRVNCVSDLKISKPYTIYGHHVYSFAIVQIKGDNDLGPGKLNRFVFKQCCPSQLLTEKKGHKAVHSESIMNLGLCCLHAFRR